MKTAFKLRKPVSLMALLGAIAVGGFAGGCASTPRHESTGEYIDDSAITTKVKLALLEDKTVKSFEIKVKTMKGVVQLSGFVDTMAQKNAAGRDAEAVNGVKDVENSLIVK